jgi:hypothetical protein
MATSHVEETEWAAGTAGRLRLLQINCADSPPSQRREFLREALADALSGVASAQREGSLAALAERFPAWNSATTGSERVTPPADVERTPEQLLEELIAKAAQMPREAKAALAQKLQTAGFSPLPASQPAAFMAPLQAAYGLARPVDPSRLAELLAMVADTLEKLDQVSCKTLENLPDKPDFKGLRPEDFHEAIKSFLAASAGPEGEAVKTALTKVLERHRRALTALLASAVGMRGVPGAGKEFARWFQGMFSPDNIWDTVKGEKGSGLFGAKAEERCWKKYSALYNLELATPDHVDKRVKDAVANSAERIFQLKT